MAGIPWPWRKAHQDAEPTVREDLHGLQLEEVSVVDSGDNPGAHLVMFKRSSAGGQGQEEPAGRGDDERFEALVDTIIQEELASGAGTSEATGKGLMTTQQMNKRSDVLQKHAGVVEELSKQHPDKGIGSLRQMAWEHRPDLAQRYQELPAEYEQPEQPVLKGADVLQQVEAKTAEIRKQRPELTPAQARVEVWLENEELRRRYNEATGYPTA